MPTDPTAQLAALDARIAAATDPDVAAEYRHYRDRIVSRAQTTSGDVGAFASPRSSVPMTANSHAEALLHPRS